MTSEREFTEFAVATSPRLRPGAFLLSGDWHTAEDLVQTTMTKIFVSWRKIRRQDAAIKVGQAPSGMAITPDGKTVYVANIGSDTVTPISTATNTAGKPIKVGIAPVAIAIAP